MTRTNAYSLLCMIIRAVAVWAAATFVIGLPGLFITLREFSQPGGLTAGLFLAGVLAEVVMIAALWFFADKLAKLALVRPQDVVFDSDIEPKIWLGLAIAAMGVWFVANALLDAAYLATRFVVISSQDYIGQESAVAEVVSGAMASALQGAIGWLCLLRGQGLSRWIHRLRYGVESPPSVNPAS